MSFLSFIGRRMFLALIFCAVLQPAAGQAQSKEYQIKAAFLLNFTKFVEWPPAAYSADTEPFRIGILGDDPFGGVLESTLAGETVKNRKIVVERSADLGALQQCQLVFICRSQKDNVPKILSALESRPVLTVSDVEGFSERGGNIGFYPEKTKIRFEINASAAQRTGLKISSDLLNLGRIVGPGKGGK